MTEQHLTQEQVERLFKQWGLLMYLMDTPRLEGGVLSIAYDVDPLKDIMVEPRTWVLRHEGRGRVRQVEHRDPFEAITLLMETEWQGLAECPGDAFEVLKHPMTQEVADAIYQASLARLEEP